MIHISCIEARPAEAVLAVAGRVAGGDVGVLEEQILHWSDAVEALVLDIDGVETIDEPGLAMLKRHRGTILRGGSAYLRALLSGEGLACENRGHPCNL